MINFRIQKSKSFMSATFNCEAVRMVKPRLQSNICPFRGLVWFLLIFGFGPGAKGLDLPGTCKSEQYYDSSLLTCQSCPANASMVTSMDGFGCTCNGHSVPAGVSRCRSCNATEIVSADGTACIPRRCQYTAGRFVCRKCPSEYISVTQNFDGSPTKEVQCVKCARGYKVQNNTCVRCEACICARNQIVVRDVCVPKNYVNGRPKYEEKSLHSLALLDVVKHEYLCTQNDLRACLRLANECVKNFYSSDPAGPCRLWIQPQLSPLKSLPQLTIESTQSDKNPGEINLAVGKDQLTLAVAVYTYNGQVRFLKETNQLATCNLPIEIKIGNDISYDCHMNTSNISPSDFDETVSPYVYIDGEFKQVPVSIRKPNSYNVQKGPWPTNKFKRYFVADNTLSTTANITNTLYLRTLSIRLRIERHTYTSGLLRLHISIEAQYAIKTPLSASVTRSLMVKHEMPDAGVLRGVEIWGGVLGAILILYAMVQWRGVLRRGGLHVSIVPLLAGSTADILYFAALFSTLHAFAAEAGTLGLTLPLSHAEELTITAFIYSAICLKALKVAWVNWNQCRCDVFFLDWSEYNPPFKDTPTPDKNNWNATTLAREWSMMQTVRRASPGYTATLTIFILHLMTPYQLYLPQSQGYKWAVASIAWWSSYTTVLLARWLTDRFCGSPPADLPRICTGVGLSLLVFQEENYAHYVHGRNDDCNEARSLVGPLATCRIVCAPQLRSVYKQLSRPGQGCLGVSDTTQTLLSRFLAAFFERALDGMSWVASERTILERLLDVELSTREAGNTSTLLYDDDKTPSCFAITWWGEEWNLATFDAMLFSSILVTANDPFLAAIVTLIVWQSAKQTRAWFGNKNQKEKTDVEIKLQ